MQSYLNVFKGLEYHVEHNPRVTLLPLLILFGKGMSVVDVPKHFRVLRSQAIKAQLA